MGTPCLLFYHPTIHFLSHHPPPYLHHSSAVSRLIHSRSQQVPADLQSSHHSFLNAGLKGSSHEKPTSPMHDITLITNLHLPTPLICQEREEHEMLARPRALLSLLFFLLLFLILYFITTHLHAFVQLFFTHSGIAITQQEILTASQAPGAESRIQHVPKIIHQVWHDWKHVNNENASDIERSMPADWEEVSRSCREMNQGWEYNVSTFFSWE